MAQTDLTPLFSEPTLGEIAAVRADWNSRPTEATEFVHERTAEIDGFTVTRASFMYEGYKQYGLVRYPRHFTSGESFPVLVLHHGGDQGLYYMDGVDFDETFPTECLADSSFVLMPTYRGEAFAGSSVLGNQYSQGNPSLWDKDCDDAMAMLTAFLAVTPEADTDRLTSLGRSRGATVAYHMAVRDSRLRRSSILFGATNFLHEDIQQDCHQEVNDGIVATNTLSRKVMAHIVWPWLEGEMTLNEARLLITGWSICNSLNGNLHLQVHHGEQDTYIPIDHAQLVHQKMTAFGANPPEYEFFSYPSAGHNTYGMDGYEERLENYLCHLSSSFLTPVSLPQASFELRAWPNPFTHRLHLTQDHVGSEKNSPSVMELRVIDLRGHLIRQLVSSAQDPGQFIWDGFDSQGKDAPAGVYLVVPNNPSQGAGVANGVRGKRILKLR